MSDVVTAVRQIVQDLIAPDLKAVVIKLEAMQKQNDLQYDVIMKTFEAMRAELRTEFAL